jgi:hypothetical protein
MNSDGSNIPEVINNDFFVFLNRFVIGIISFLLAEEYYFLLIQPIH